MSYHNDINGRNEDGLTGRWKSDEKGVGSIRWNVGFQLFRNVTNDPYKTDNVELRGWRSQSLSNVRLGAYFAYVIVLFTGGDPVTNGVNCDLEEFIRFVIR